MAEVVPNDSPEQPEATCPLCEDYTGTPSQVEAHITGKSDEAHAGELGSNHRDEIEKRATGANRSSTSSSQGESSSDNNSGPGPSENGGSKNTSEAASEQGENSAPSESDGILWMLVAGALAIALAWRTVEDNSDDATDQAGGGEPVFV